MSLKELQSSIAQLPRQEQAELLRFLARELRGETGTQAPAAVEAAPAADRSQWLEELRQLREGVATGVHGTPLAEILDDLRADRT